ncbi:MAG: hypothetical protein M3Q71_00080 [Chloroflexota bacterium]|nr:hypothetical protein [Chloroflexota bacterium]
MSTTYQSVGEAIYALINAIVITSVFPGGWGERHNWPPKQIVAYPAFSVVPAEDIEEPMDAITDDDRVTYWVYLTDRYDDASDAESRMRRLVDLVRTEVRRGKRNPTILGGAYALGRISGVWGANVEQGERFYRLSLEVRVDQSLV